MAVKLRLMRMGKTKQPTYRVVAANARSPRNGRFLELLGTYEPRKEPSGIRIDADKINKWLANGAQPTERVQKILEASGILTGDAATKTMAGHKMAKRRPGGGGPPAPQPKAAEPVSEAPAQPTAAEPASEAAEPEPVEADTVAEPAAAAEADTVAESAVESEAVSEPVAEASETVTEDEATT